MESSGNRHWTEDHELLERFVLDRLDENQHRNLQAHLRVCEVCMNAVQQEQQLAAGIRRAGRDLMKKKLQQHIADEAAHHAPWPKILSAAAVVAIVTGVGIYNEFLLTRENEPSTKTETTFSPLEAPRATELQESPAGRAAKPLPPLKSDTPLAEKDEARSRDATESFRRTKQKGTRSELAQQPRSRTQDEEQSISEFADKVGLTSEGIAQSGAVAGYEKLSQLSNSIWVQGVVVPSVGSIRTELEAQSYNAAKKSVDERNGVARRAGDRREGKEEVRVAVADQTVTLNQEPFALLPPAQQKSGRSTNTVQAQIDRTSQGLQITLYLEEPLSPADLSSAIVEQRGEDTLVVLLADQRIVYRLPSGWNSQQIQPAEPGK